MGVRIAKSSGRASIDSPRPDEPSSSAGPEECGGRGSGLRPVTLPSGEKLSGSITFLPAPGRPGQAATTKLAEGSYQFDRSNGPDGRPSTVIMRRVVSRAKMIEALKKGRLSRRLRKEEWTGSAEIADDGQYLHNFKLND